MFDVGQVNIVDIQATYGNAGALSMTLTSPEGTRILLFEDLCNGIQDVDVSLSDTTSTSVNLAPCGPLGHGGFYIPQEALSTFCGESAQGDWTLEVSCFRTRRKPG